MEAVSTSETLVNFYQITTQKRAISVVCSHPDMTVRGVAMDGMDIHRTELIINRLNIED
jgi:hypothetical protein